MSQEENLNFLNSQINTIHHRARRDGVSKQIIPKPPELKPVQDQQLELKKKNIPWARLLARVFNIDVETCSKCGGKMKIIAAIEDHKVIRKILNHMGLDTKPPPLQPARGPPLRDSHFTDDFCQQHFEDFQ